MNFRSLAFESVTCVANDAPLHRPVSLELAAGGRALLSGPSGLGKTTLLRAALGFAENWTGAIRINGQPPDPALLADFRRATGYLPQKIDLGNGPLPHILDELLPRKDWSRNCREWAARLNLPDRIWESESANLSGGELQRLGLAILLSRDPAFLALDEPTASLDDDSADRVIDILVSHPAALLLTSHDARLKKPLQAHAAELLPPGAGA